MTVLNCPSCGSLVSLSLTLATGTAHGENDQHPRQSSASPYAVTIGGRRFELTIDDVRAAVPDVSQPIHDSYVEIADVSGEVRRVATKDLIRRTILRKYPDVDPQTELQATTGFQSQRAEQIARRLGLHPQRRLGIAPR